jgi:peptide/nickel transport system permease protein
VIAAVTGASPAERVAGKSATAEEVAQVAHTLGTDRPLYAQYGHFLWRLLHGDLGYSYLQHLPVTDIVGPAIGATASLVIVGAVLWMLIAVPIGLIGATRPRGVADRTLLIGSLIAMSVPTFWLAPLASYYLAFEPTQGQLLGIPLGGPRSIFPIDGYIDFTANPIEWLHHLLLPALVFAVGFAAVYARFVRALTIDELAADYVRTARAKGAAYRRVLFRHAGRNVAPTIVTLLGMDIGAALAGVIFVEAVFGIPGLGSIGLKSILDVDYPLTVGVLLFAGFAAILVNTIVDIVHGLLDPRVRVGTT